MERSWGKPLVLGLLTLAIFIEKTHQRGPRISQAIGIALIGLGLLLLAGPLSLRPFLFGP